MFAFEFLKYSAPPLLTTSGALHTKLPSNFELAMKILPFILLIAPPYPRPSFSLKILLFIDKVPVLLIIDAP